MGGWTFLNPVFLWGLGLGALPILIHLLQRRRFRVRRWAAMEFLRLSTRNTARRLRIEQLLLLLVRITILTLVVLALARPVVSPSSGSAFSLVSRQARVHATILLDHSYSMGYAAAEATATPSSSNTHWERAKARALELIRDSLRQGDSVSVILAGDPPRALIRQPTFDLEDAARRIRTARLSDGGTNFARAARLCLETLKDAPHPNREVYLITDNQAVGWRLSAGASGSEIDRRPSPDSGHQVWREVARLARLYLVVVGEPNPQNVAVVGVRVGQGLVSTRRPTAVEARIANYGDRPRRGLLATLVVNDRAGVSTRVDLPARGEATVRFTHLFATPGVHAASVRVTSDRLPRDDEAYFRVRARESLRVLCLNGRPSIEPRRDAAFYLRHALSPGGGDPGAPASFIQTTVVPGAHFGAARPDAYDVVILADVPELSGSELRAFEQWVRDGGGGLVFLGDGTGDGELLKLLGVRHGLQGEPRASALTSNRTVSIDPASLDHPVLARFKNAGDVDLTTAMFERHALLTLPDDNRKAHVMARFSNGSPAWIEARHGRGRVILAAHTAGVEGSNLPFKPMFVPLLHQMVTYLAQGAEEAHSHVVGDRLEHVPGASDQTAAAARYRLTDPEGNTTTLSPVILAPGRAPVVRYDRADRAGIYRLEGAQHAPVRFERWSFSAVQRGGRGSSPPGAVVFAVNLPRGEGDLRPASRDELARLLPEVPFHRVDPNQPLSVALREARLGVELWRPLLVMVLALMLLESFLAQRFGRQSAAEAAGAAWRRGRWALGGTAVGGVKVRHWAKGVRGQNELSRSSTTPFPSFSRGAQRPEPNAVQRVPFQKLRTLRGVRERSERREA